MSVESSLGSIPSEEVLTKDKKLNQKLIGQGFENLNENEVAQIIQEFQADHQKIEKQIQQNR